MIYKDMIFFNMCEQVKATSKNSTSSEILSCNKRTFACVDFVDVAIARNS